MDSRSVCTRWKNSSSGIFVYGHTIRHIQCSQLAVAVCRSLSLLMTPNDLINLKNIELQNNMADLWLFYFILHKMDKLEENRRENERMYERKKRNVTLFCPRSEKWMVFGRVTVKRGWKVYFIGDDAMPKRVNFTVKVLSCDLTQVES